MSATPARPTLAPAANRTLIALLASALGALPMCQVFTDRGWLVDVWLSMAIVVAPAFILRLRRPAGALQVWPGIVLLVLWLVARFVPHGAWLGVIPNRATTTQVGDLLTGLHQTAAHEVAPVHTTVAIRLALCAMLGLLAALVDLLAVVGRHGALAGVPLLVVFTVAGTIPKGGVGWHWFVASAIGFLLLLGLDARDSLAGWGHRVARQASRGGHRRLDLTAQRIGVVAIIAAVLAPLVVPTAPADFVPGLFERSGGGSGSGNGFGVGGEISPWVALKGQLLRPQTLVLATVDVGHVSGGQPFYLRTNVLNEFTGDGWAEASHGATQPLDTTAFDTLPADTSPIVTPGPADKLRFEATIHITGMRGNAPVFALPTRISGLSSVSWSPQDQLLLGTPVTDGTTYTEDVAQPQPSPAELRAAQLTAGADYSQWLQLTAVPGQVRDLVHQIVGDRTAPYDIARAINDFFTDPANGFSYSLQTKAGDSGNDLVDFLTNRVGYCQQYAAAMGVMLRLAGVPARVVLGYSHAVPNAGGTFQVTTDDAHAWVEAYLGTIGWVAFDPTPLAGITGGAANDLPWAPHAGQSATPTGPAASRDRPSPTSHSTPAAPTAAAAATPGGGAGSGSLSSWLTTLVVIACVAALCLLPWFVRVRRRRTRLRHGADAELLWAELRDTTVDLGYLWSTARSPRQVVRWLRDSVGDGLAQLRTLALAVERQRYAGAAGAADRDLRAELTAVQQRLRAGTDRGTRLRATFLPLSLGWRLPLGRRARRHR